MCIRDRLYECPDGVVPITTLVLGYAEETPELTDRLPVEAIVHQEVYKQYSEEDIDRYYQEKEELPLTAKLLEENQLKTLAQIFTQKRYTRKDNVNFSKALLEFLTKTGYMNHQE
jgi:hypothetical protein